MPKEREAKNNQDVYRKGTRDTYLTRSVQTTPRDFGDKRNILPPPNVEKNYKDRSKYDGRGNLKGRRKEDV